MMLEQSCGHEVELSSASQVSLPHLAEGETVGEFEGRRVGLAVVGAAEGRGVGFVDGDLVGSFEG